jgi:hypothetical protein
MGQVSVTAPYNGNPLDADAMRAALEVLAAGINSIDNTQLGDGVVLENNIGTQQVSMSKLKGGQYAFRGVLSKADGTDFPSAQGYITYDGTGGDYKGSRFTKNVWKLLNNTVYDWRMENGDPFIVTPPQNCYGIILCSLVAVCKTNHVSADIQSISFGISNRNVAETPSDGTMTTLYTEDMEETDISTYTVHANLMRFAALTAGQSYHWCPAMRFGFDETATGNTVKFYASQARSSMGVILLPR